MLRKATTKNTYNMGDGQNPITQVIYIYISEEVRQKVVIYNVMTLGFYPSSINQLLII
jgi:hypothetical protein